MFTYEIERYGLKATAEITGNIETDGLIVTIKVGKDTLSETELTAVEVQALRQFFTDGE
jgi:hypothetical protein